MQRVHATCVYVDGMGLLITGPSGCGKSDLALRLIDGGARLIADDQVEITAMQGQLMARCPETIKGLMEARHVGVLPVPYIESAPVMAVLAPGDTEQLERIPQPESHTLAGITLPLLRLPYTQASTPAKVRLWLKNLNQTAVSSSSLAWPAPA